MSNIVEKVKDKVENVLHKDKHHDTHTGTHTVGTTGHHNTSTLGGSHSTNAGPHDSNIANKADPRVDSDRDGSANLGAASYGPGGHHHGHHNGQHTGVTSGTGIASGTGYGSGSTNHGPHDSNLLNKADPRVDSDRDGSRNAGAAAYGPGAHQNTSGFGNTGVGSGSTNYGPHDSNLANKADPRVDSDRDGSRNVGAASYGAGAHQTGGTGFGTGTHQGGLGGNSGPGAFGGSGPGPAAGTAGPHSSNLANKLDPRVDSDLDGSKTFGGNQTNPTY